ncbi:MAG TPA: tetratricopeptide repeat protein, partial [Spirochaetia bacterium]|nr:tetratricopeptide repeat protein [Spirochaetia bacterium]
QIESLYSQGLVEYANHNYQKAIDLWEQVLVLDPHYQPAAEYIATAKKTLMLQEDLTNRNPQ